MADRQHPHRAADAARDFGHLHNEGCFPQLLTLSGPTRYEITSLAHQNPGRPYRVGAQTINGVRAAGAVGDGCGAPTPTSDEMGIDLACLNLRPLDRGAAQCEAMGGKVVQAGAPPTCKWTDAVTLDPATLATSGLLRMKTRVIAEQPTDVVRPPRGLRNARAIFSGAVLFDNGGAPSGLNPHNPEVNHVAGTGWGTGAEGR